MLNLKPEPLDFDNLQARAADERKRAMEPILLEYKEYVEPAGWDFYVDYSSGLFILERPEEDLTVYATPYYEGYKGISLEVERKGERVFSAIIPFLYIWEEDPSVTCYRYLVFTHTFLPTLDILKR